VTKLYLAVEFHPVSKFVRVLKKHEQKCSTSSKSFSCYHASTRFVSNQPHLSWFLSYRTSAISLVSNCDRHLWAVVEHVKDSAIDDRSIMAPSRCQYTVALIYVNVNQNFQLKLFLHPFSPHHLGKGADKKSLFVARPNMLPWEVISNFVWEIQGVQNWLFGNASIYIMRHPIRALLDEQNVATRSKCFVIFHQ